ncbi:hypothetical protein NMY22_g3446 [Coprinellus aureogranulatus]|nr:hypothetical protein NMY22_g3446 [Coprinellus aureogranulatus]
MASSRSQCAPSEKERVPSGEGNRFRKVTPTWTAIAERTPTARNSIPPSSRPSSHPRTLVSLPSKTLFLSVRALETLTRIRSAGSDLGVVVATGRVEAAFTSSLGCVTETLELHGYPRTSGFCRSPAPTLARKRPTRPPSREYVLYTCYARLNNVPCSVPPGPILGGLSVWNAIICMSFLNRKDVLGSLALDPSLGYSWTARLSLPSCLDSKEGITVSAMRDTIPKLSSRSNVFRLQCASPIRQHLRSRINPSMVFVRFECETFKERMDDSCRIRLADGLRCAAGVPHFEIIGPSGGRRNELALRERDIQATLEDKRVRSQTDAP